MKSEGWWYVATGLNLFSGRIVGWAMDDHMTDELTNRKLIVSCITLTVAVKASV